MASPVDFSVVCPILIGRDSPLTALDRLIENVRAGQGRLALIAGNGKFLHGQWRKV